MPIEPPLSPDDFIRLGQAVENARLKAGLKQEALASAMGVDTRSYRKVKSGEHRSLGLYRAAAQTLGFDIDSLVNALIAERAGLADAAYGAYAREATADLRGQWSLFRRSFTLEGHLFHLRMTIDWSNEHNALTFHEDHKYSTEGLKRVDHSQHGLIHISRASGQLHFVTQTEGSVRLMTTGVPVTRGGHKRLNGGVFTQVEGVSGFRPAFSPLFMDKAGHDHPVGPIAPGDNGFDTLVTELDRIEHDLLICPD